MDSTKSIFQSKTVQGIVLAVIAALAPTIASKLGVIVTATDGQSLLDTLSAVGQAIGALYALYGRIVATKKIG